jgi:hypothetical protein
MEKAWIGDDLYRTRRRLDVCYTYAYLLANQQSPDIPVRENFFIAVDRQ